MESWFLTCPDALAEIYGNGFDAAKLPVIPTHSRPPRPGEQLEAVSKEKVIEGLAKATKETRKGAYNHTNAKTTVAPRMLEKMDLHTIGQVSFHADRLRQKLEAI